MWNGYYLMWAEIIYSSPVFTPVFWTTQKENGNFFFVLCLSEWISKISSTWKNCQINKFYSNEIIERKKMLKNIIDKNCMDEKWFYLILV